MKKYDLIIIGAGPAGLTAKWDDTNNPLKQIITACGQSAVAANSVYREIMKEK